MHKTNLKKTGGHLMNSNFSALLPLLLILFVLGALGGGNNNNQCCGNGLFGGDNCNCC